MKDRNSVHAVSKIASITAVTLIIVASVLATYSYLNANGKQAHTVSVTTTLSTVITNSMLTTVTTTTTITSVANSNNRSLQLYDLIFNQTDVCTNWGALVPWSVILTTSEGTYNITEPSDMGIPLSGCCGSSGLPYSSIVFSVPNGNYSYVTYGFPRYSGNVTVEGQDVTITITDYPASCGSSTTSISTTSS